MGAVMAKRSSSDGDDESRQFASPACLMHEVDPVYMGLANIGDPQGRGNIMRWRKAQRARLIAARLAIPADERAARARRLAGKLDALLPNLNDRTVSLYWPLRGEPDLRDWLQAIQARGAICALPVVVERNAPMIFRTWRPGEPIVRGFWNIPVPEQGMTVSPDIVLAPVVGLRRRAISSGIRRRLFRQDSGEPVGEALRRRGRLRRGRDQDHISARSRYSHGRDRHVVGFKPLRSGVALFESGLLQRCEA